MPCVHYEHRPQVLKHPEVIGVFVGGCVSNSKCDDHRAHAHIGSSDPYQGWICFMDPHYMGNELICLHELAHILTLQWHTPLWRKTLLAIGGTLDPFPGLMQAYYPKKRKTKS